VDKLHYLHSRNGRVSAGTDHNLADVSAIVDNIIATAPHRLIIHFHGGLVSKEGGMTIAETLYPVYQSGGYSLFFVWESGAWEAIRNNAADILKEPIFRNLVRKVLEYALGKVGFEESARSVTGTQVSPSEVKDRVDAWFANPTGNAPYADARPPARTDVRTVATDVDDNTVQMDLLLDPDFVAAVNTLSQPLPQARSAVDQSPAQLKTTRIDPAVLDDIAPSVTRDQRGVISIFKIAMRVARVVRQVLLRIEKGRDHGFYATVVEEVLRAFYCEAIGKALLWNQMKKDTGDAFGQDVSCAGSALLSRLKDALGRGLQLERIFLIGHSTGGIYISHFLEAVDAMGFDAKVRFDVVLLAPANTHKAFAQTIEKHAGRIRWLRLFGMQDALERDDGLLGDDWRRAFYPSSLLYLVSGLLEDEVDEPILGMQRFINQNDVFNAAGGYAACDEVRTWLSEPLDRLVWSNSIAAQGQCTLARKHGDFDNDASTLQSLTWIVSH
jgi:hypothetical protein